MSSKFCFPPLQPLEAGEGKEIAKPPPLTVLAYSSTSMLRRKLRLLPSALFSATATTEVTGSLCGARGIASTGGSEGGKPTDRLDAPKRQQLRTTSATSFIPSLSSRWSPTLSFSQLRWTSSNNNAPDAGAATTGGTQPAAAVEEPEVDLTKLTPEEEREKKEREKDEEFFRRLKLAGFAFVMCLPAFYIGNKWGKQAYWGGERSARVSTRSFGKPSLGGPFTLVTHEGEPVSQAAYLGKWCFFYFGFVHCPEICPIELNRMTKVVNWVKEAKPEVEFQPLFVSCDPKRDSLLAIKEYLSVFHPDFIGLVGTPNQVNEACKSYRIFYSVPNENEGDGKKNLSGGEGDDYLIDHSIAIFLFDPKGQFVDFFGTRYTETEIRDKVLNYVTKFQADPTWTNW
jgi:protein SCO1/2